MIIINRATTSTYDGIALLLTVIRTLWIQKQALHLNVSSGLVGLLLRDGSLYFGCAPTKADHTNTPLTCDSSLLIINLAQIIVTSRFQVRTQAPMSSKKLADHRIRLGQQLSGLLCLSVRFVLLSGESIR